MGRIRRAGRRIKFSALTALLHESKTAKRARIVATLAFAIGSSFIHSDALGTEAAASFRFRSSRTVAPSAGTPELPQAAADAGRGQTSEPAREAPQQGEVGASPIGSEFEQASALARSGDPIQAEKILRHYLQNYPQSGEGHFLLGYVLFREIQARARTTTAARSAMEASLAEFRDEHARASLAQFTEGAKYHKPSAFDLKIVAADYILLDDSADADKWLTRALEWNPSDSDGWYTLGRTKYTENRFEEAIHAFQECLRLDPRNVKAEDNLGLSYYGLGRVEEALAAYKTAIDWVSEESGANPPGGEDAQPFIDLGTLYLDQNRPNDALPVFVEATQIAPGDAKAHEGLGQTYSHLNQLPQAQGELEKAIALAPNVASLHFMLGQVYRKEGMLDKANLEFDRTSRLNGTHSSPEKPID